MAIGNQSLNSALHQIGRNPGPELGHGIEPWASGGSVTGNIVECGLRSRSPIVEHACTVLIWARTRSLEGLIAAIDDVLIPVGEAQLAVEEESLVTLTQQRAVTFAMSALIIVMLREHRSRRELSVLLRDCSRYDRVAHRSDDVLRPHRHAGTDRAVSCVDTVGPAPGFRSRRYIPMADAIPYAVIAALVIGAWASGMLLLDLFAPADARAWQRMAHLRGFETRGSVLQRLARKAPPLTRLQRELDLEQLLAQAHSDETPAGFLARTCAIALMTFAVLLAVSAAGRAVEGQWPVAPWVALMVGILILPLSIIHLRRKVRDTQARTARNLGDTLMAVAVMTDTRGLQLDDAVRIMSRCAWDGALQDLLNRGGFKRLVRGTVRSTSEKYRMIGEAYRIREFSNVADGAPSANVGSRGECLHAACALGLPGTTRRCEGPRRASQDPDHAPNCGHADTAADADRRPNVPCHLIRARRLIDT